MDALGFLKSTGDRFSIALLDPPYQKGLLDEALPLLAGKMEEGGVILCESEKNEILPQKAGLSLCIKNTATARKKSPCIEKRKHNWKRELRSAPAALTPSLWDTWTLSAGRPPCLTR